jgi:hypothetical protein
VIKKQKPTNHFSMSVSNLQRCSGECHAHKPVEDFASSKATRCRSCEKIHHDARLQTELGFAQHLAVSARGDMKFRQKIEGREDMKDSELTAALILKIFEKQDRKDYYTGMPLEMRKREHFQTSKERIDSSITYSERNTVLSVCEMNGSSQWTVEKVKTIPSLVEAPILDDFKEIVEFARTQAPHTHKKRVTELIDGAHMRCSHCGDIKENESFCKQISNGCSDCRRAHQKTYLATLRGFMFKLISSAKLRTKIRRKAGREMEDVSLTLDQLLNLLVQQGGRCAYSNIPLALQPGVDWCISIERISDDIGYVLSNVKLVCFEFNTAKQWSREKFLYILKHVKEKYNL